MKNTLLQLIRKSLVLKNSLKKLYYFIGGSLSYFMPRYVLYNDIQHTVAVFGQSTFVGYYDIIPLNVNGQMVYHDHCGSNTRLKIYNLETHSIDVLASSPAWNFQQGARLGWIPSNNQLVHYNSIEEDRVISILQNIVSGKIKKFPFALAALHPEGHRYLSMDYISVTALNPEYGYSAAKDHKVHPSKDNIYEIIYSTGEYYKLITLNEILGGSSGRWSGVQHEINHLSYSKDGQQFAFIHRWYYPNGLRESRLLTYNFSTMEITSIMDEGMVSHYTWIDNSSILVYGKSYKQGEHFYRVEVDAKKNKLSLIAALSEMGDGHPAPIGDSGWFIIDSYPGFFRYQNLIAFNPTEERVVRIGKFRSPLKYQNQKRCDLHPRASHDGKHIIIDSPHTGKRSIHILDIGILNLG